MHSILDSSFCPFLTFLYLLSEFCFCSFFLLSFFLPQGYAAGNAIPSPLKNVEKEFLKKYWAKWKAGHTGRWYVYLITRESLLRKC